MVADKITLRGHAEYQANVSPSPAGSISSLKHAARSIEEHAMRGREELLRCRKNVVELTALNGAGCEHEERYRELLKRQAELIGLLDIAKNQANARQASETTGDVESIATMPDASVAPPAEDVEGSAASIPPLALRPVWPRESGR